MYLKSYAGLKHFICEMGQYLLTLAFIEICALSFNCFCYLKRKETSHCILVQKVFQKSS